MQDILIVEDNQEIASLLADFLGKENGAGVASGCGKLKDQFIDKYARMLCRRNPCASKTKSIVYNKSMQAGFCHGGKAS